MIAVLDYGGGNVGSVLKAIEYLGLSAERVDQPAALRAAEKIIFPGQGHFGAMMKGLAEREMLDRRCGKPSAAGKPFLGICLGLQALYESSEEAPGVAGLGILPGCVTRFQGVFKVPHVGWSQLVLRPGIPIIPRRRRRQLCLLLPFLLRARRRRKLAPSPNTAKLSPRESK